MQMTRRQMARCHFLQPRDLAPADMLRAHNLTYPYTTGAIFVMPHEKVQLSVTAPPSRLFSLDTPQGALTATGPNMWTWEAPGEKGRYALDFRPASGSGDTAGFKAFVMVPATEVRGGLLNGYEIGLYPATPLKGARMTDLSRRVRADTTRAWSTSIAARALSRSAPAISFLAPSSSARAKARLLFE